MSFQRRKEETSCGKSRTAFTPSEMATGDLIGLWEDARIDDKHHNQKSKHFTVAGANAKRALRLAREGRYSNAMKALGSLGCAPLDDTSALDELRQRHPEHLLPEWNEDIPPH